MVVNLELDFVKSGKRLGEQGQVQLEIAIGTGLEEQVVVIVAQVIRTLLDRHGHHPATLAIRQDSDIEEEIAGQVVVLFKNKNIKLI